MSPVLPPMLVAVDALCAMGMGFLMASIRAVFLVKNKFLRNVVDFLITFFSLFLLQVHVAQNSSAGEIRFFMLAAMIFGVFAARFTIIPIVVYVTKSVYNIMWLVCLLFAEKCLKTLFFWLKHKIIELFKCVLCEKFKNKTQKHLKSDTVLLYNSTIDN